MSTPRSEKRGEPSVAVFLTWFLPGAGHLYLGRASTAVLAFLVVEGLYALGWFLSGGRTFEFLDPELRGPFATLLSPEVGNLGAMIAQMKVVGFGTTPPSPLPDTVHLGSWLAGASGILNAVFMVHAHLTARGLQRAEGLRALDHPAVAVGAAWAIPGLGHFLQGRRLRAAIVFALLLGFFVVGTLLAEGANLSRERHFYYWAGQFLLGLPALVAEIATGRPPVTGEQTFGDVGLLYACMPGLLNVLAMLDVYGFAERRWTGEAARSKTTADEATPAPAPEAATEEASA